MILKASQRGNGQNLATHLMRTDDNEHVLVHELRGFASDNLKGAFRETEAISRSTKCQQYLFSVSLNPPAKENVPLAVFEDAISRIENRMCLDGQPRAVVVHEKEGRRHVHCVWSRIDADTLTARQLSFFKQKLMGISRDIFLEQGWTVPRGLANAAERNPTNFTLAEWQQAKRQGVDPRWLKSAVQDCWTRSDSRAAFARSLEDRGFFLAKGDRRGHVVLDHQGEVWSLPRLLDAKTKDVRGRLGEGDDLPSVTQTLKTIGERMTPAIREHVAGSRERYRDRSDKLFAFKLEMTRLHRKERSDADERLGREWQDETRMRASRLPKGVKGIWHRITGRYGEVRRQNEQEATRTRERHTRERQELVERQLEQRRVLQAKFTELRRSQAALLLELRADVGRYLRFSRGDASTGLGRGASLGLKLER
jgi:hypothetical protein